MSKNIKFLERELKKLEQEDKGEFMKLLNQYVSLQDLQARNIQIRALNEEQQRKMKVEHFKLHLPPTMTGEQLKFIKQVANSVISNEPITLIHEEAMRWLLKWAYFYKAVLEEFDEKRRWSDEDDISLRKISREFAPILEWLNEKYKLNIRM